MCGDIMLVEVLMCGYIMLVEVLICGDIMLDIDVWRYNACLRY